MEPILAHFYHILAGQAFMEWGNITLFPEVDLKT